MSYSSLEKRHNDKHGYSAIKNNFHHIYFYDGTLSFFEKLVFLF